MKTVGKNAMDKIYVSWEDSVAAAVERYKIVLEKYRSGEYEREQSFSDEWFAAEGELLDGINRSRNMRHRLKNAVYLYGKEKNRKMKNSAKNFYQGINEKRKKAVSSFREKLDKYL